MSKGQHDRSFLLRDSVANVIRIFSLLAISLGLFAMAAGGAMAYLELDSQLALERADRAASQQAREIADRLDGMQDNLREAGVVDAARSGDPQALRNALRERGIVNILDARVLPARIEALAEGPGADLGFDLTEFVIEAIRDGRAQIRVLQPGTPAESLALAERLPADGGIVLLRLTVNALFQQIEAPDALDFVALAQRLPDGHTVLTATGRSAAAPIRSIPIEGSELVLQWSRAVFAPLLDTRGSIILACSGLITLMVGLLLRRRTRLAQYLERPAPRAPAAEQPVAAAHSRRGAPLHRQGTVVLDDDQGSPQNGAGQKATGKRHHDEEDDEPPTVVADPPDLPAWLVDDDSDPDKGRWS